MRASRVLALLCVSTVAVLSSSPAHAINIRRTNPFRSFNTSGLNYGSMQWEKSHRQKAATPSRTRSWRR
jgi:hypothetical protein